MEYKRFLQAAGRTLAERPTGHRQSDGMNADGRARIIRQTTVLLIETFMILPPNAIHGHGEGPSQMRIRARENKLSRPT